MIQIVMKPTPGGGVVNRETLYTALFNGEDVGLRVRGLRASHAEAKMMTANADGCVVAGTPSSSKLLVGTLYDEFGKVTVVLETDNLVVHMKTYERDMLVEAINSQVWRLFQ